MDMTIFLLTILYIIQCIIHCIDGLPTEETEVLVQITQCIINKKVSNIDTLIHKLNYNLLKIDNNDIFQQKPQTGFKNSLQIENIKPDFIKNFEFNTMKDIFKFYQKTFTHYKNDNTVDINKPNIKPKIDTKDIYSTTIEYGDKKMLASLNQRVHFSDKPQYKGIDIFGTRSTQQQQLHTTINKKIENTYILTSSEEKFNKIMKSYAIKKQFMNGLTLSIGVTIIFNLKSLFFGEFSHFFLAISKTAAMGVATQLGTMALSNINLDKLAPGTGIIIHALIDGYSSIKSGDWSRFGLNIAKNTISTIGGYTGGKLGASIGSMFGPIGTIGGAIIGGIGGSLIINIGISKSPIGNLTKFEKQKLYQNIIKDFDNNFKDIGINIDTDYYKGDFNLLVKDIKNDTLHTITNKVFIENIKIINNFNYESMNKILNSNIGSYLKDNFKINEYNLKYLIAFRDTVCH